MLSQYTFKFNQMNINYPLLLDGGLSNELEKQGCDLSQSLWSARFLESDPEAIVQAHLSYLKAGAQCIITSSYQATIPGFTDLGYDKETAETLIMKSVLLAEEAIERFTSTGFRGNKPLIAASIGPYGAYLADGSEYNGNYGVSGKELKEFHQSRMELLDSSNADFFACETIPSFEETEVLADLLTGTNKQAWISFSCKDELHINDGTPIRECAALIASHPNIFATGVNCTNPDFISGLISAIKSESGSKKIVVYPNSGESYNAESKTWTGKSDPDPFMAMVKEWLVLGADIIGGCCRIGPDQIRSIREILTV